LKQAEVRGGRNYRRFYASMRPLTQWFGRAT
jgi:hypothetical protein